MTRVVCKWFCRLCQAGEQEKYRLAPMGMGSFCGALEESGRTKIIIKELMGIKEGQRYHRPGDNRHGGTVVWVGAASFGS
jgi:hypothetical protein